MVLRVNFVPHLYQTEDESSRWCAEYVKARRLAIWWTITLSLQTCYYSEDLGLSKKSLVKKDCCVSSK